MADGATPASSGSTIRENRMGSCRDRRGRIVRLAVIHSGFSCKAHGQERRMINIKLIDDYHKAKDAYEAAKVGIGCRVETFTRFLVAEQVLLASMRSVHQKLADLQVRYSP